MARKLAESTSGAILPTDIEELTLDQFLILTLPKSALSPNDTVEMTLGQLENAGIIPPQPEKSQAQLLREKIAARNAAEAVAAKATAREERRKRRRGR